MMMLSHPPFATAIIVAAGQATRFGGDLPKQYMLLHGIPVLRHTIFAFLKCPHITQICVVIRPEHQNLYDKAVQGLERLLPPVHGGATRQESVFNALMSLPRIADTAPILIHDAARPCVTPDDIARVIESLDHHQAVTLVCPVQDSLRRCDGDRLGDAVDRDGLMSLQTPQGFHFSVIQAAHQKFAGAALSDDTNLVSQMGIAVHTVTGNPRNIKITRREDSIMAESFLSPPTLIPRTGMGFDVHAFGDESSTIRLGGIDIPHTHKLAGHSDADVVLHAITDALYGTLASGDIGSHFPPSDNSFKGMDSSVFLKAARDDVAAYSGRITHIDCMIMCEAPKIGPYREAMQQAIASILDVPVARISVKATTTEGLGFTGRREGIAAQAVATVLFPMDADNELG